MSPYATAKDSSDDPTQSNLTDSLKRLSLEALGDLEVTTLSKEPEQVRRVPAAIYVITQDDIRQSGATTFPEILRLAPGVDVGRIDSDHWSVGIRGLGDQFSKSVLVLIDGRSVYTPLFAGVMWAVQDAAIGDIDRIEVIRGPGGTIWGANAVDGVINIITKRASETHGTRVSIGTGTVDRAVGDARYGGGNGNGFDYRVYFRGFDREPQFHPDGSSFDDWNQNQAGFRTDWTRKQDSLTVQGDVYHGRDGQSVSIGSFAPPSQVVHYEPVDVSGGNLFGHWRRQLHGGDVQVQGYYDRTSFLGPQIGESRNTFDVDLIHHLTGLGRHVLTWGVGARQSAGTITQTVATLDVSPHDHADHVLSAFAQDEVSVVDDRLWLTVGNKLEHNNYTGVELQPSARMLWAPTRSQSLWGAVTRAVRTPSRLEEDFRYTVLASEQPLTFLEIVGNRAFEPERRISYEAGYRSMPAPTLNVDVTAFHARLDNLESLGDPTVAVVTTPPAHLLLSFPFANGVMGSSNGVELAPTWSPSPRWQTTVSYSYLHLDLTNTPGNKDTSSVATYEGSSPRHQARIQSRFDLWKGWEAAVAYRHVGALPARDVPAYNTFDARVSQRIGRGFEWAINGQNLGQHRHLEFGHDPGPAVWIRRSVYASITWER